ncbi:D-alanine--poly(phosphoribitol) ligase subunit 1 [Striga asiatica]|uniref:D-alanine--poly(Phosphoribitol) ligase subunit 1 n=1 Tax=Striga asiatica TaxID=4170 RepID=A0A5A7PYR3_STRAF|nr:D-alanine--poly(phosphoribitol) ligase subunit 1 [Striga asiatica]
MGVVGNSSTKVVPSPDRLSSTILPCGVSHVSSRNTNSHFNWVVTAELGTVPRDVAARGKPPHLLSITLLISSGILKLGTAICSTNPQQSWSDRNPAYEQAIDDTFELLVVTMTKLPYAVDSNGSTRFSKLFTHVHYRTDITRACLLTEEHLSRTNVQKPEPNPVSKPVTNCDIGTLCFLTSALL